MNDQRNFTTETESNIAELQQFLEVKIIELEKVQLMTETNSYNARYKHRCSCEFMFIR